MFRFMVDHHFVQIMSFVVAFGKNLYCSSGESEKKIQKKKTTERW